MAAGIMGIFKYEDELIDAARQLKDSGFEDVTYLTPVPLEPLLETVHGPRKSQVRRFSLTGAIIGAVSGFALAAGTALVFITPTGGRPIITFPPFLVITYEMTILLGVLFTLLGFHVVSGLPAWRDKPYDERFNVDRFGVLVPCSGERRGAAREIIEGAGAEQVKDVEEAS